MKQEDKELLLKDLSARLPYGIYCKIKGIEESKKLIRIEVDDDVDGIVLDFGDNKDSLPIQVYLSEVRPYLRSMMNMTKKDRKELQHIILNLKLVGYDYTKEVMAASIDFYNSHHLDYRNLISKGLALEAPEGMYKIK